MSYSDDDSNLLNNNAHNYSYPYTSNIEAYRTEVSLPPPHFVGYVPNNIPTDDDNQDDELNEEMYNFNIINNQNDENNNYLEELIDDKQEIYKNVETNKKGIGSSTREERTREKTKTIFSDRWIMTPTMSPGRTPHAPTRYAARRSDADSISP